MMNTINRTATDDARLHQKRRPSRSQRAKESKNLVASIGDRQRGLLPAHAAGLKCAKGRRTIRRIDGDRVYAARGNDVSKPPSTSSRRARSSCLLESLNF